MGTFPNLPWKFAYFTGAAKTAYEQSAVKETLVLREWHISSVPPRCGYSAYP